MSHPGSLAGSAAGLGNRRNVLIVNVDEEIFAKVAPLLDSAEFEVDRFPGARAALELTALVPFDVLIALFPLPDIPVPEFLDSIRSEGSPCRRSPLLLLCTEDRLDEARVHVGRGVNRVMTLDEPPERLQHEVSQLLKVPPRRSVRLMVRVKVVVDGRSHLSLYQTENLSISGMLLRGGDPYPVGTHIGFEMELGHDRTPICGEAEVTRHTTPGREEVRGGMGVRFFYFEKDGLARVQRFLKSSGV